MPNDLKLGADGDIDLTNGRASIVTGADAVRQSLQIRLRLFLGEWFMDTRLGVDFYGVVFVKNPNLPAIEAMLKRTIVETDGVGRLLSYTQTLDRSVRGLTVSFSCETTDGDVIVMTDVLNT